MLHKTKYFVNTPTSALLHHTGILTKHILIIFTILQTVYSTIFIKIIPFLLVTKRILNYIKGIEEQKVIRRKRIVKMKRNLVKYR